MHIDARALRRLAAAGGDAHDALEALVELARDATAADVANAFVLDPIAGELRLAASRGYDAWVGRLAFEASRGLSGWSVVHRTAAVIGEDPEADPRTFVSPELGCDAYSSALALPLLAPAGDVVGVLHLEAVRRHAFDDAVERLEPIAAVAAAGLAACALAAAAARQEAALTMLATPPAPARPPLRDVVDAARAAAGAGAALLAVATGPDRFRVEAQAAADGWSGPAETRLEPARLAAAAAQPGPHTLDDGSLALPLRHGGEPVGVLLVLDPATGAPPALLAAVARVAALTLAHEALRERAVGDDERALVDALLAAREPEVVLRARAARLGLDLGAATQVAIEATAGADDPQRALEAARARLRAQVPASATAVRGLALVGLVAAPPEAAAAALTTAVDGDGVLAAGLAPAGWSTSCAAGLEDALDAARLAGAVPRNGRVLRADRLGATRQLLTLARAPRAMRSSASSRRSGPICSTRSRPCWRPAGAVPTPRRACTCTATPCAPGWPRLRELGLDLDDAAARFDVELALRVVRLRRALPRHVAPGG